MNEAKFCQKKKFRYDGKIMENQKNSGRHF